MKRKDFVKLYTVDYVTDEKGKTKKVHRYIGKKYSVDQQRRRELLIWGWSALALATAAFLAGGFIPCSVQFCVYVLPFFAFCVLAYYFLYIAMISASRMKDVIDEIQLNDGLKNGRTAATALMLLGGAWALASIIFFIFGSPTGAWYCEGAFCLCGAVNAAAGWIMQKRIGALETVELPQEEPEEPEEAAEPEEKPELPDSDRGEN